MRSTELFAATALAAMTLVASTAFSQQGVGIDVPNPLEKLDVNGAIKIGTDINNSNAAPTGGAGTIRFKAGQFEGWNGASWIPLGGGADSDWTVSGNNQYSAVSGDIGIGTAVPHQKVHIHDGAGTWLQITNTGSGSAIGDGLLLGISSANEPQLRVRENWPLVLMTNDNERMRIQANGNVGIGTSTTPEKLTVNGKIQMQTGATAGYIPVSDANGTMTWTNPTTVITAADGDGSSTNELQTLSQTGLNVTLSNGGGTISVADNDNSTTNELQTLSISGNDITLSNGGGTVSVANDADWTISNNDQYSAVSGNVGIGTSTPSAKLEIAQPASGTALRIGRASGASTIEGNGQNNSSNWLILDGNVANSGNVGLNYYSSGDVNLAKAGGNVLVTNANSRVGINTASPMATVHILDDAPLTPSSPIGAYPLLIEGDFDEAAIAFGTRLIDPTITPGAVIGYDPISHTSVYGSLYFQTKRIYNDPTAPLTTAMEIDYEGDVAIGNVNPTASLNVYRDISAVDNGAVSKYQVSVQGLTDIGAETGIAFSGEIGQGNIRPGAALTYEVKGTGGSITYGDMHFKTRSTASTSYDEPLAKRMTIAQNGNVGIGTTNPAELLDVQGSIQMVDGNQQAGYIPVSDANGKMTWTNPTTISSANDADWTVSGSDQYSAVSGNVGIGISTPDSKLHVSHTAFGEAGGIKLSQGSNSSVMYHSSDGDLVLRKLNVPDQLVLDQGGNVGIGTSAPARLVHVHGGNTLFTMYSGSEAGIEIEPFAGLNGSHAGGRIFFREDDNDNYGYSIGYDGSNSPTEPYYWPGNSFVIARHSGSAIGQQVLMCSSDGKVGIGGVDIPLNILDVNGRTVIGAGYAGTYNAPTNGLLVQGTVGIGVTDPWNYAKLTVSGTEASGSYTYGYLNSSGNTGTSGPNNISYSIWASGRIRASEFNAMSDARAKTIVQRSEKAELLALVNELQVTEYAYIDSLEHGTRTKQGFIAQEIEKVYPNAINKNTDYIPNVFARSTNISYNAETQLAAITVEKPHTLTVGDKLKLMTNDETLEVTVEDVADANTFTVKMDTVEDLVFVYGKQVNDFRAVDYDQLFSIGIGAIQELAEQVEELQDQNGRLEKENTLLRSELHKISTDNEARLRHIEDVLMMNAKAQR
ncbi:MAG: tail fiber domain-containing protein [Flavobacteriales bacterium]|nr:tail fiber domain-containing protein [Flavobacteriales bacterium]